MMYQAYNFNLLNNFAPKGKKNGQGPKQKEAIEETKEDLFFFFFLLFL